MNDETTVDFGVASEKPLQVSDSAPYLFVKEEPSTTVVVPAEERTLRVPRRA